MNSSIETQDIQFFGTMEALHKLVKEWRTWLRGDPEISQYGSYRVINGTSYWHAAPSIVHTHAARQVADEEWLHFGAVTPFGEEGRNLRISLTRILQIEHGEWAYNPGFYGAIVLYVRQQKPGNLLVRLEYPPLVQEECQQLSDDLTTAKVEFSQETSDRHQRNADLVRRANWLHDQGKRWTEIADDLGIEERHLRRLRSQYEADKSGQ